MSELLLSIGEFYFGSEPTRIRTVLGSCVAITMWCPQGPNRAPIGGMCHYLLPSGAPRTEEDRGPPGMYAEQAIQLFVRAIHAAKTRPHDYVVKLFGGGRMFNQAGYPASCDGACSTTRRASCTDIACKNVLTGREMLAAYGFCIAGEHVGGFGSRDLILDMRSGDVWLKRGVSLRSPQSAL